MEQTGRNPEQLPERSARGRRIVERESEHQTRGHRGDNMKSAPGRQGACPECGMTFSDLSRHMRTHFAERLYPCDECGKTFTASASLHAHKRTHSREEWDPYRCDACGEGFSRESALRVHAKRFHVKMEQHDVIDQKMTSRVQGDAVIQGIRVKCEPIEEGCTVLDVGGYSVDRQREALGPAEEIRVKEERKSRKRHMKSHSSEERDTTERYTCTVCDEEFMEESSYVNHHREAHNRLKCPMCPETFSRFVALERHVENMHNKERFKCGVCGKEFLLKCSLDDHVKNVHNKERFKCGVCGMEFLLKCSFEEHKRGELFSCGSDALKERSQIDCNVCGERFENIDKLLQHRRTHELFSCEVCGETFRKREQREVHRRTHAEGFSCDLCSKTFQKKKKLNRHKRTHREAASNDGRNDSQQPSDLCDKTFQTGLRLRKHRMVHTVKYWCSLCGKAIHKNSMDQHSGQHRGTHSERFPCDLCGKTFGKKSSMVCHRWAHRRQSSKYEQTGRQHPCDLCGKVFRREFSMMQHRESHDRFSCDFCDKTFNKKKKLERHMQSHSWEVSNSRQDKENEEVRSEDVDGTTSTRIEGAGQSGQLFTAPCVAEDIMQFGLDGTTDPFDCGLCGKVFDTRDALMNHVVSHNKDGANQTGSQRPSSTATTLAASEHGYCRYPCEVCGARFSLRWRLDQHFVQEHPEVTRERFWCETCHKFFTQKNVFLDHKARCQHNAEDDTEVCGDHTDHCHDNTSIPRRGRPRKKPMTSSQVSSDVTDESQRLGSVQEHPEVTRERFRERFWCETCHKFFTQKNVFIDHKVRCQDNADVTVNMKVSDVDSEVRNESVHHHDNASIPRRGRPRKNLMTSSQVNSDVTDEMEVSDTEAFSVESERREAVSEDEDDTSSENEDHTLDANRRSKTLRDARDCDTYGVGSRSLKGTRNRHWHRIRDARGKAKTTSAVAAAAPSRGFHPCYKCGESFTAGWRLEQHFKRSHPEMSQKMCRMCGARFDTRWQLEEHLLSAHEVRTQPFQCDQCHEFFPREQLLIEHRCHANSSRFHGDSETQRPEATTSSELPCVIEIVPTMEAEDTMATEVTSFPVEPLCITPDAPEVCSVELPVDEAEGAGTRVFECPECALMFFHPEALSEHVMTEHAQRQRRSEAGPSQRGPGYAGLELNEMCVAGDLVAPRVKMEGCDFDWRDSGPVSLEGFGDSSLSFYVPGAAEGFLLQETPGHHEPDYHTGFAVKREPEDLHADCDTGRESANCTLGAPDYAGGHVITGVKREPVLGLVPVLFKGTSRVTRVSGDSGTVKHVMKDSATQEEDEGKESLTEQLFGCAQCGEAFTSRLLVRLHTEAAHPGGQTQRDAHETVTSTASKKVAMDQPKTKHFQCKECDALVTLDQVLDHVCEPQGVRSSVPQGRSSGTHGGCSDPGSSERQDAASITDNFKPARDSLFLHCAVCDETFDDDDEVCSHLRAKYKRDATETLVVTDLGPRYFKAYLNKRKVRPDVILFHCDKCNRTFPDETQVCVHLLRQDMQNASEKNVGNDSGTSVLQSGVKTIPGTVLIHCDQCDRTFTEGKDACAHWRERLIQDDNGEPVVKDSAPNATQRSAKRSMLFTCSTCDKTTNNVTDVCVHFKPENVQNNLTETRVVRDSVSQSRGAKGVKVSSGSMLFHCDKCDRTFTDASEVCVHLRAKYTAATSGPPSTTLYSSANTGLQNPGKKLFQCGECGVMLFAVQALCQHMKAEHSDKLKKTVAGSAAGNESKTGNDSKTGSGSKTGSRAGSEGQWPAVDDGGDLQGKSSETTVIKDTGLCRVKKEPAAPMLNDSAAGTATHGAERSSANPVGKDSARRRVFQCAECQAIFFAVSALVQHMRAEHADKLQKVATGSAEERASAGSETKEASAGSEEKTSPRSGGANWRWRQGNLELRHTW